MEAATLAGELRRILDQGLVRSVYQPIVDPDTEEIVGNEAIARGPEDSPLEGPDLDVTVDEARTGWIRFCVQPVVAWSARCRPAGAVRSAVRRRVDSGPACRSRWELANSRSVTRRRPWTVGVT